MCQIKPFCFALFSSLFVNVIFIFLIPNKVTTVGGKHLHLHIEKYESAHLKFPILLYHNDCKIWAMQSYDSIYMPKKLHRDILDYFISDNLLAIDMDKH